MATVSQIPAEQRFLMHDVSWDVYQTLVAAQDSHRTRMTYDRGTLELMSPSSEHEWIKSVLGRLVEILTLELDIPIRTSGSTTLRKELLEKGLEADESYYIRNEPLVRGRRKLDVEFDPPPDLAIEVDITSSSIDRMAIYSALGIAEVWVHDGKTLRFFARNDAGEFQHVDRSPNLPMIEACDIAKFIDRIEETDEGSVVREFRQWVRDTLMSDE